MRLEVLSLQNTYSTPVCLALGFFDCMHLGHQSLISHTKMLAERTQSRSCVLTFCNNPYSDLSQNAQLIFSFSERLKLFDSYGLDSVLAFPFDRKIMETEWEEFLKIVFRALPIRGIVCGHDFRFGRRAEGNAAHLTEFCRNKSVVCDVIPPVMQDGERISSTEIRTRLANGDIPGATRMLGHPYFITGEVCRGRGVGKVFGFPTANLACDPDKLLPQKGVYATVTDVAGKQYKSVTNIGDKPTFAQEDVTIETLLSDFEGDLYGKRISVEFVRRLRSIRKFSSPYELQAQILKDADWR